MVRRDFGSCDLVKIQTLILEPVPTEENEADLKTIGKFGRLELKFTARMTSASVSTTEHRCNVTDKDLVKTKCTHRLQLDTWLGHP